MLHFLADENFNNHIVIGLLRRAPSIDIVRVQDVGLAGVDDETLLAWAAEFRRIILTHDAATLRLSPINARPQVLPWQECL